MYYSGFKKEMPHLKRIFFVFFPHHFNIFVTDVVTILVSLFTLCPQEISNRNDILNYMNVGITSRQSVSTSASYKSTIVLTGLKPVQPKVLLLKTLPHLPVYILYCIEHALKQMTSYDNILVFCSILQPCINIRSNISTAEAEKLTWKDLFFFSQLQRCGNLSQHNETFKQTQLICWLNKL